MKNLIIVMIVLLCSCSFGKLSDNSLDKIITDMGDFNKRIRGKLYRGEFKKDLRKLNKDNYIFILNKYKEPSEVDYVEFFEDYGPEIILVSKKKNFLLCIKSKKAMVTLCDIANTYGVDVIRRSDTYNSQVFISKFVNGSK